MAIVEVADFTIVFPKKITFQITPEKPVNALKGTLFRKKGASMTTVKTWTASQLKNGVSFTADEDADRFEISVTATVNEGTSLTGTTTFDPTPPKENVKKTKLKATEGVIERLWFFFPINL